MYEEDGDRGDAFGHDLIDGDPDSDEEMSILTKTEDRLFTESMQSSVGEDMHFDMDLDQGNLISPIKINKYRMQKQLPKNNAIT